MSLLNEAEVREIVQKAFDSSNVRVLRYEIGQKSDTSIGYLGNHLTLTVNVSVDGNDQKKIFFVKTYHVKENSDDFIGETGIFQKEVDMYRVFVGDLKEFVREPDWCPKYYYNKKRVLVLEDLSEKGFRMATDNLTLNKDHIEVALKTLSSMHASSLILEKRNGKPLNITYPHIFKEILYDENKPEAPSRKWIGWQTQDLLLGIDYLDRYSSDTKKLIKERFTDEILRIYPLSKPSQKYQNVLTHGDMWRNNLLFQYSGEVPTDCRFVDFQFSRYAPPAHDVMHLLHYATKKSFRNKEEMNFLSFYYKALTGRLEETDTRYLTWDEFVDSCKEYKELALIQCLLSTHYILGPVTLKVDTGTYQKYEDFLAANRKEYMKKFFGMESYVDKVTDILYELIDNYIMNE